VAKLVPTLANREVSHGQCGGSFFIIFFDSFGFVDVFSDEKTGLYFSVFAWHRQRSLSQI
jgi:hypothetical protein